MRKELLNDCKAVGSLKTILQVYFLISKSGCVCWSIIRYLLYREKLMFQRTTWLDVVLLMRVWFLICEIYQAIASRLLEIWGDFDFWSWLLSGVVYGYSLFKGGFHHHFWVVLLIVAIYAENEMVWLSVHIFFTFNNWFLFMIMLECISGVICGSRSSFSFRQFWSSIFWVVLLIVVSYAENGMI